MKLKLPIVNIYPHGLVFVIATKLWKRKGTALSILIITRCQVWVIVGGRVFEIGI